MITKIIQDRINVLDAFIKPTIDNKNQFETNLRNSYTNCLLTEKLDFILKNKNYIGMEVFKFKKNIAVTTMEDYNSNSDKIYVLLNPIEENGFVYSQEDYELFVSKYIAYQIESLTNDLIKNKHYSYSTNPLYNLEAQWITECKQNLIEFLSEIKLS